MSGTNATWKVGIPWSLVWFRGVLAPVLTWWGAANDQSLFVGALMIATFFSDWFDGVLARRWNSATPALRRADSLADTIFYVNVVMVALIYRWDAICPWTVSLGGLLLLEIVCQLTNYARFGCRTATHAYLCKIWAILLCAAASDLLVCHAGFGTLGVCITVGYIAYADVLMILWLMPIPAVDVPTSWHAWQTRKSIQASRTT